MNLNLLYTRYTTDIPKKRKSILAGAGALVSSGWSLGAVVIVVVDGRGWM